VADDITCAKIVTRFTVFRHGTAGSVIAITWMPCALVNATHAYGSLSIENSWHFPVYEKEIKLLKHVYSLQ